MDPLTVAVDVAPLHGHRTGVATAVGHVVDELRRRDDVDVLPYVVSFRARPVPPERRLPFPAAFAARVWARTDRPRVDRWLGGATVIHGGNYVAPPTRLPTVISVYDCWFLAHPDDAAPAVRRAAAALRRAVARGAWIHVSSTATADAAADLLHTERIQVIHLGPPDTEPTAARPGTTNATRYLHDMHGIPDGARLVLTIGTVERRKDLGALVRAMPQIARTVPDVHLAIAGAPGDDSERVAATIAALPADLRERVHVLGPVDAPTKQALFTSASALAYPSLDEGFGFPILEAQAAGLPVVARRVGSIPEVGGDAVELVDPTGHEPLATGLTQVLASAPRRQELVERGRRNLARFSWSSTVDGLIELYRHAIDTDTTARATRP